jgi:hypothetical protein
MSPSGNNGKRKVSRRQFFVLSATVVGSLALKPVMVHAKAFSAMNLGG